MPESDYQPGPSPTAHQFVTTHWSVVQAAANQNATKRQAALAELCQAYWYPLYAFVRRQGRTPPDAEDLTQDFFATLLEKKFLDGIEPGKGKFRSFLLVAFKRFLANMHDRDQAWKRGGRNQFISLDQDWAETRFRLEPADKMSADRAFERRWAQMLLDRVLADLEEEHVSAGKGELFKTLRTCLSRDPNTQPYADLGQQLGLSTDAVKMAVQRLRAKYRERLRREIAKTVSRPEEINDEIRHLFAAFDS